MENDKSENQPIISSNNSRLNIENNLNLDSLSLNDKKHHHRKKKKRIKKRKKKKNKKKKNQ